MGLPGQSAARAPVVAYQIKGTFIQYLNWMMINKWNPGNRWGLDKATWEKELDAMRKANIDTIIIQWLQIDETRFIPEESDRQAVDATEVIMNYADKHHMKVILGLWGDNTEWFSKAPSADSKYLLKAANNNIRVAEEAWNRYGRHASFAGWYIPQELWNINFTDEENSRMRTFHRRVSDYCKSKSGDRPVTISPFYSPFGSALDPEEVVTVFTKFLTGDVTFDNGTKVKGAGVDRLYLHDGTGARCWNTKDEIQSNVQKYFPAFGRAVANASSTKKVELWANIENFRTSQGGCLTNYDGTPFKGEPASLDRLKLQLAAVFADPKVPVQGLVTFDFFHYMSPIHGKPDEATCFCSEPTLEARKKLFDDYRKDFVKN